MLINCPECARDVSDKANACPNCGHPIASAVDHPAASVPPQIQGPPQPAPRPRSSAWYWFGAVVILLIAVAAFNTASHAPTASQPASNTPTDTGAPPDQSADTNARATPALQADQAKFNAANNDAIGAYEAADNELKKSV